MKYFIQSFFLLIMFFFASPVNAFTSYAVGSVGFDISFPQCTSSYPEQPYDFGIIGVTGGKAFTTNPCLLSEFLWAKKAKLPISVYMNLNYPSGATIDFGSIGPTGTCSQNNKKCRAYNYGYTAAQTAYEYATSQSVISPVWWIDIETANTWSDTTVLNTTTLQGAIDFLSSEYIQTGIYSTKRQWTIIMGKQYIPKQDFITILPNWVVDNDSNTGILQFCFMPFIQDSPVWLVQYSNGSFDGDYVCI